MNFQVHVGVHVAAMVLQGLSQGQEIGFIGLGCQQIQCASDHLIGRLSQCQTLRGVHFGVADLWSFDRLALGCRLVMVCSL